MAQEEIKYVEKHQSGDLVEIKSQQDIAEEIPGFVGGTEKYRFLGWATVRDGGGRVDYGGISSPLEVAPTQDLKLYAQWTKMTCVVTFNPCGGEFNIAEEDYAEGGVFSPSRGFEVEVDSENRVLKVKKTVTKGQQLGDIPYVMRNKDTKGITYIPTDADMWDDHFDWTDIENEADEEEDEGGDEEGEGGEGGGSEGEGVDEGGQVVVQDPDAKNYFLVGWFSSATGGEKITRFTNITQNIVVYAQWYMDNTDNEWQPEYCTVTLDGYPNRITVVKGTSMGSALPYPSQPEKYGWFDRKTGKKGNRYQRTTTVYKDVTLYVRKLQTAVW